MTLHDLPLVLTRAELAQALRCSEKTIRRRERAGAFAIPRLEGRRAAYARSALARYLDHVQCAPRGRRRQEGP
jgi:predicted site-specific integrase-resolvase